MRMLSFRSAAAALVTILAAACTTSGVGTGRSPTSTVGAAFTWTQSSSARGTMVANLTNGEVFQGPMFQITQESRITDFDPLWTGWGRGWRRGWHGWGSWGPSQETITHYTGQVLANLQGPGGYMRCRFSLMRPTAGMAGGGSGECQLPTGAIINAQFPPR